MNAQEQLSKLLLNKANLKLVEPGIYSWDQHDKNSNPCDRLFGSVYDIVACNWFYNRIVWGYETSKYHSLCLDALESSTGWMLDAGCGSLAFTARAYIACAVRPVVLLDQSIHRLRMARERLKKLKGDVPQNMVFLHGDVLDLPFKTSSFDSILSLNLLHVLESPVTALIALRKILAQRGTLYCTTLVKSDRFADRYLDRLAASKLLVPRHAEQVAEFFDQAGLDKMYSISGSLATIRAKARDTSWRSGGWRIARA